MLLFLKAKEKSLQVSHFPNNWINLRWVFLDHRHRQSRSGHGWPWLCCCETELAQCPPFPPESGLGAALARHTGSDEREVVSQLMQKISLHLMRGNAAMITSRRPDVDFLPPDMDGVEWFHSICKHLTCNKFSFSQGFFHMFIWGSAHFGEQLKGRQEQQLQI